jgi:thiamine biosynthesis lipoprotein
MSPCRQAAAIVIFWLTRPPRIFARRFLPLFFALSCAAALPLHATELVTLTGRAMGTTWSVKYLPPAPPSAALSPAALTAQIAGRLEQLEHQFSTYRPGSELSRFNASVSTDWIPVSPELASVAAGSRRLSELTSGAFDATVAPLLTLWGFGPAPRIDTLPSDTAIAATRARVDYRRLEVRLAPPALRKITPDLAADFSSMAKGFGADAVSDLLLSFGALHHLVQIGGDIKTRGHPADAPAWRTAIENPLAPAPGSLTAPFTRVVALSGQALSTSGDARNFTLIAGHRYGHIIEPRTGRPVSNALASVSVIADTCAQSSAWATALFVLGPENGLALARREKIPALFFLRTGDIPTAVTTPEFDRPPTYSRP